MLWNPQRHGARIDSVPDRQQIIVINGADRPHVERPHPAPTLQKLVNAGTGSTALTVLVNVLGDGESVPEHVHDVEEVLIVVEGSCQVSSGDELYAARAGDAVIVPPGTVHGILHTGSAPTRVIAAIASASALPDQDTATLGSSFVGK